MKVRVESYSGYKPNERPIRFWIGNTVLLVESIEDQWFGIGATHFRVRANDGKTHILSYSPNEDAWNLFTPVQGGGDARSIPK
jgi:hypothetical protein